MEAIRRAIIGTVASAPRLQPLLSRLTGRFAVFYAHVVSDAPLPHIRHLYAYRTPRQFERDLDMLLKLYRPIALDELVAALAAHGSPPVDTCLLTFDDGLREAGEVIAPILKRRGIPAAFFINSDFVGNKTMFFRHKASLIVEKLTTLDPRSAQLAVSAALRNRGMAPQHPVEAVLRLGFHDEPALDAIAAAIDVDFAAFLRRYRPYLGADELRAIASDGFTIGAHSRSHPPYASLPFADQLEQTLSSVAFVRQTFQPKVLAFSFPFNDRGISMRLLREISAAGVSICFGTDGLRRDSVSWSLQRIQSEDPRSNIRRDLAAACLNVIGRGPITRSEE